MTYDAHLLFILLFYNKYGFNIIWK